MSCSIIDCHCHVYPEKIAERAVENIGAFYDIEMTFDGKYSTLKKSMQENSVKHGIIFSVATTPAQVHSINCFIAETVKTASVFLPVSAHFIRSRKACRRMLKKLSL